MDQLLMFAALMFLAFVATEGTVEFALGTLFDKVAKLAPFKWTLMYVSLAVGIFLAFYYALDVMSLFGLPGSPVGMVISGIVIGRGANYVSSVFQRFFGTLEQRIGEPNDELPF